MIIHNDEISRIINLVGKLSTLEFRSGNQNIAIESGIEFAIHFNRQIFKSDDFRINDLKENQNNKQMIVYLHHEKMDVKCIYQAPEGKTSLKKWLEIEFHEAGIVEKIVMESFAIPKEICHKVARGIGEFDICLFLWSKNWGLFFTLDFPYNDIIVNDGRLEISYPPYQSVSAGEIIHSHVLSVANYPISGINRGGYDLGQAEAFRRYLLFDYAKPHLQGPQLIYTSIVNQYTEVNFNVPDTPKGRFPVQNKIFYSLTNAPYLMLYPERIPEEIDFCKELSMEFCQIYEGPFEWNDEIPDEKTLKEISDYARKSGVKLGLYTGANNLTAPHFNHYGEQKGKPEWCIVNEKGKISSAYCFGSDEFARWFTDILIQVSRNYGFLMTNFDFLEVSPCYAENHGHPPGGVYQQIANVNRCLKEIREAVNDYVFDSNLGWSPFIPKIANEMDGFYFTDPYVNTYFPALNATKILDDSRRTDMMRYFRDYLTPVEYFRNCEYFVCADSVVHDFSFFEYGILQGLAVTPNLQLGESLALFQRFNSKQCEHAKQFLDQWTQFVRENWEYYHYTKILTDLPAVGQVEIYAHCKANRGYVFLVNPNPFSLSPEFALDETIGITSIGDFTIKELYPEKHCLYAFGRLPYKKYGDMIEYTVMPQSCVVLAIEPYSHEASARLFGLPANLLKTPDGYQTMVSYYQGHTKQLILLLPGEEVKAIYSDGEEIPFTQTGCLAGFKVTFPKGKVEPEILQWVVSGNSLDSGLKENFPSGIQGEIVKFPVLKHYLPKIEPSNYRESLNFLNLPLPATFLGASIENLLNERYPVKLRIITEEKSIQTGEIVIEDEKPELPISSDQKERFITGYNEFWLSSNFEVPFIQRYIPPGYYDHNFIMLNFLKPEQVREIHAWINGSEAIVNRYEYWRGGPGSFTYYLDGTRSALKSGKNCLVLWIRADN